MASFFDTNAYLAAEIRAMLTIAKDEGLAATDNRITSLLEKFKQGTDHKESLLAMMRDLRETQEYLRFVLHEYTTPEEIGSIAADYLEEVKQDRKSAVE